MFWYKYSTNTLKRALIVDIPYLNNLMEAEHGGNINEQHYFNDCHGPV